MIIKNPYGFYAKHHKIIHVLLLIPMIYLIFCFGDISNFFKDYVTAGYSTPETNITETYINGYLFLITFLLSLANGIIFIILSSRKKKGLYYGISTLYYIVLLFCLLLYGSTMSSIENNALAVTFANLVRDTAKISYLPLYVGVVINAGKAVGFNIRTLRFDAGSDLKISEEDEEDIELNLGGEEGNIKRNIIHIIHELKYYVLENLFVMKCLGVVALIIIGYNLYAHFQIYNKTYAVNQAFQLSNFTLALKESYITNVDFRGSLIDEGKYYLVIKIGIENNGPSTKIENSSFRIVAGNQLLYPSYDKASRFIDIGATYQGEVIASNNPKYYKKPEDCPPAKDYVFVYELTKKQIKASYQMRILSSLTQTYDGLEKKYKKITVKPQNITKTQNLGKVKSNKELNFKDTMIGKTKYKVEDYEISTFYEYSYNQCNGTTTTCSPIKDTVVAHGGSVLLVIKDEIKWDTTTQYYANSLEHDFYADFVTLNYKFYNNNYGEEGSDLIENTVIMENVAPKVLRENGTNVYEVPQTIETATKINLIIRIRNKYLTLVLKD